MSTEPTHIPDQTVSGQLLDEVLADSHPLMAEGFFLAALPYWYNVTLFAAMRQRADNRDEGIVERLSRYSFIATLEDSREKSDTYTVHPLERALLNERWIAQDPGAYREAHRRALAYWEAHPDPNPDAHARNLLYHRLLVDPQAGIEVLIGLFRTYSSDRQLAAIERMLATAREARRYLLLLGDPLPPGFDDLLAHLATRLNQLRGHWAESLEPLEQLRKKSNLSPRLLPYVIRAHGDALANASDYVAAIKDYEEASELFDRQAKKGVDPENIQAERAYTLIALGDAHADLARAALGHEERNLTAASQGGLRNFVSFLLALPLVIYLSRHLGAQVWHPRYWGVVANLDWIIARLFAVGASYYRHADPILEAHGKPSEGVVADQKLAALYLELGDAHHAQNLYARLLDEEAVPLGEYRQATARLGLGRVLLAQGQPQEAQPHLEAALPLLRRYEDAAGEALAELTLADALRAMSRPDDALPHCEKALLIYEKLGERVRATLVGERLDALARDESLSLQGREKATRAAETITLRHYPVRYRHPTALRFQRIMVIMLTLVIFLTPILAIRLEIGTAFEPNISFQAAPLLDNKADFNPDLGHTVRTFKPAPVPDVDVLWQAALLLLLFYLILFSVVGLLVIVRTRLSTVQTATYADTVRLDQTSIRTGEGASRREVAWPMAQELVRANVYLVDDLSRNDSRAAVAAQDARVIIEGRTAWYESLLQRIDPFAPPQVRRADVSFNVLRSPMGALYLITLAALILLSILSLAKPELLFANLAGTPYSLADLYPYFYLGLFLPPMGWFVIQPLRQRRRIDPQDIRPALIVGGVGLALAALRVVTRFRPWLTVPDIYPTLTIIILVGSAVITLLRAPRSTGDRVPVWARGLGAAAAVLVLTLMTAHLWREVVSYDYLVRGNKLRDEAVLASPPDADTLGRAKNAYDSALQVADTPLLGIKGWDALQGGPGLPSADKFIWAAATNSRAVMRLLLGEDPATIKGDFAALLRATQHPAVYVERALAALCACTRPPTETPNAPPTPDRTECLSGVVDDLSRAIDQEQENDAKYLLWRGFAHHSLGSLEAAEQDYRDALNPERGVLEEADRATALTGLGWIDLGRSVQKKDLERRQLAEQASRWLQQAIKVNPKSADAELGLGYAFYTLRKYDEALNAWLETKRLRPEDPAVQLSLGALYWRMGSLVEGYVDENGTDKKGQEYCRERFSLDRRTTAETRLKQSIAYWTRALELPGLSDKVRASTYSSLGQIYFLMQSCPNLDETEMLQKAVESNDVARKLDPTNAAWPYRSGGLANNLFVVLRDETTGPNLEAARWALRAMQDYDRSIALSTVEKSMKVRQDAKRDRLPGARDYARAGLLAERDALKGGSVDQAMRWFDASLALASRTEVSPLELYGELEGGDMDRAMRWFDVSLALASRTEISPTELYGQLEELEAWLTVHPDAKAEAQRPPGEVAIRKARSQYTVVAAFLDGLAALKSNRIEDATQDYRRGLEEALAQGDLASIAAAAIALRYEDGHNAGPLLNLLRDALPRVEETARAQELFESVDAAVRTAVLAAALDDYATAGQWLDEATRRTAIDSAQYNTAFLPAREHMKALWAAAGAPADASLTQMNGQLSELLAQTPDLEQNGLFWRYRAWLKYHLGLSAFRVGDEAAASNLLQLGIQDATRAYEISTDHQNVYTYLPEAAWGWYHVARGDDSYAQGQLDAALVDYEAAFDLIEPKKNSGAKGEKTLAAFRAGYTALQLGQPERAAQWYLQAVTLAEQNTLDVQLEREITKLQTLLEGSTDAALAASGEKILAQAQAAYDRMEQR